MEGYRTNRSTTKSQAQNPPKQATLLQKPGNIKSSNPPSKVSNPDSTQSNSSGTRLVYNKDQNTQDSFSGKLKPGDEVRTKRARTAKPDDEKTVKNPEAISPVRTDNEDLINGLALQRQWDEKPDIDNLSNSLLNLYQKLESKDRSGLADLRAKIFLSSLRVRSKSISYLNFTGSRLKSVIKFSKHLNLKYNTVNYNVPRIEKHYLALCKYYQRKRGLNEVYEKLSSVVSKLPGVKQAQQTAEELAVNKAKTLEKIAKIKEQIQAQKDQINEITQSLSNILDEES
ncbi:uncharacterized protein TA13445 [Theileria annulata]|uniref:Uncharacterized protein n=1 Tax=Theileria annulata TaxID=5874 RepID=Q4UEJ0_THEAN|nr:uncharacterized protein TA13445 [Theileria annulata]CAI74499.1 hypothetical protein TA13445 [Theileria annulata]|eukprot:XP_952231.1 hypothetical protein TA13445 [Theileria annulata]